MPKPQKGAVVIKILIVTIFTIVAGPIVGALIGCGIGLWCNTGGGGGGGGGAPVVQVNDPCTSAANACGQTNTGFIVDNNGAPECNATAPDNSSCPAPTIPPGGFTAQPSTVGLNGSTTLTWNTSNTTSCTITGDNGFSTSGGSTGSVSVSALTKTTTFTLTCIDGDGGPSASASIKVIVDPHYKEI